MVVFCCFYLNVWFFIFNQVNSLHILDTKTRLTSSLHFFTLIFEVKYFFGGVCQHSEFCFEWRGLMYEEGMGKGNMICGGVRTTSSPPTSYRASPIYRFSKSPLLKIKFSAFKIKISVTIFIQKMRLMTKFSVQNKIIVALNQIFINYFFIKCFSSSKSW